MKFAKSVKDESKYKSIFELTDATTYSKHMNTALAQLIAPVCNRKELKEKSNWTILKEISFLKAKMALSQGSLLTICQGGEVEHPNLQVINLMILTFPAVPKKIGFS